MILKRAHIQNFRSVCNAEISFGRQTALLGGNGVGKSTVLKALEKFYGSSSQVELDDFFGKDARESIKIALTFCEFTADEATRFASRIHGGEMVVVRIFEAKGKASGQYFGFTYRHLPFGDVREAQGMTEKKSKYRTVKSSNVNLYSDLPDVSRGDEVDTALEEWESNHRTECELALDNGRFFGFTNVANGALQKSTSFVFIPAVREASSDAVDSGRSQSPIARLMELVVRSAVQRREDIQNWQQRMNSEYRDLTNPENLQELDGLASALTQTLQQLYAESAVNLTWKPAAEFEVPLPNAEVLLEDGGFSSPVDRQGHGLQRAFIMTLLQHLALAVSQSQSQGDEMESLGVISTLRAIPEVQRQLPGLILAIEEPELYQHPAKQRHFASVLTRLTTGALPGVAGTTQVAFASHSPYFVSVDRFDEVRIARRHHVSGTNCKQCSIKEAHLSEVASRLEAAFGETPGTRTVEGLRTRLHAFSADLAEGFFAESVVLVEGRSDKAAILAQAAIEGIELETLGVSILVSEGKEGIANPAAIFNSLGIPVYLLWDCDSKPPAPEHQHNNALQRILADDPRTANVLSARTHIGPNFGFFEVNLEKVLVAELSQEVYDRHRSQAVTDFGLAQRSDAQKMPAVMTEIVRRSAAEGNRSASLSAVLDAIKALAARARVAV